MSVRTRQKPEEETDTDAYEVKFEDAGDVSKFESQALTGQRATGVYDIDATEVDETVKARSWEGRHTPGMDVEHGEYDVKSIAMVLEDTSAVEAKQRLEQHLDEEYEDSEFLTLEGHRTTVYQNGDRTLARACRLD